MNKYSSSGNMLSTNQCTHNYYTRNSLTLIHARPRNQVQTSTERSNINALSPNDSHTHTCVYASTRFSRCTDRRSERDRVEFNDPSEADVWRESVCMRTRFHAVSIRLWVCLDCAHSLIHLKVPKILVTHAAFSQRLSFAYIIMCSHVLCSVQVYIMNN